jgi:signal transduction histidine kinase
VKRSEASDGSRPWLIAGLLVVSLLLACVLAWQAHVSVRDHRAAAEKLLRDYAMLAMDEFTRRTGMELGYTGFFQLVTALRQGSKTGLPTPEELRASPDETLREASDLVHLTLSYDPVSGRLDTRGGAADAATRAWMLERLAAMPKVLAPDRRYETAHGDVAGGLHSLVLAPVGPDPGSPLVGFEVDGDALALRFRRAFDRGPLLPPSFSHHRMGNKDLSLWVHDPFGREVFRSGSQKDPTLEVEQRFGSMYNQMLEGFVIHAAVDPAAAPALVIGGLPRSRLPFLLSLLALTAGLMLIAGLQLRRERALARLRSDFVSRVSHELRTPLTQIRMFAETLLLERVRSEAERKRSLEIIDREARRLSNLVENVLRFSRGERGEDRVDARPRDVVPLVRQLLREFEALANGRSRVVTSLPERAIVRADEDGLRQILLNLLDNAAKYGPDGQEIRVGVEADSRRVVFSVEDQGPGIPAAERERIWSRFYRLPRDRASSVAGTGIGLAIVRDLVRLQGGRSWVEDGTHGGARFRIELPAASEAEVIS